MPRAQRPADRLQNQIDRPAGFASAVEVFHPDKRSELFLNEIAVIEGGRRRGVAGALIRELKRLGREHGRVSMWVLTMKAMSPRWASTEVPAEGGTACLP